MKIKLFAGFSLTSNNNEYMQPGGYFERVNSISRLLLKGVS